MLHWVLKEFICGDILGSNEVSSSVEDYLEAIYILSDEKEKVGTSDIASFLNVKLPSVTEMMEKLGEKGLVDYKKYGKISLTSQGEEKAKKISQRHRDLVNLLELLGVGEDSAQRDACKIEHVVGDQTMKKLRKFLDFVENSPKDPKWLRHYQEFDETGEHPACEDDD